jgi:hypothetical protein
MTKPVFTPGPWEAKLFHVHVEGKGIVCNVPNPWNDEAERQANARLIAAAPDLYGQLESGQTDLDLLRRAIEENDPKAELLIRVTDLWKRNEASLAKARGEA